MASRHGVSAMLMFLAIVLCVSPAHAQWAKDGVLVCGETNYQYGQKIISDGTDGAIVLWMDYRNGSDWDIYGNHVDRDGYVFGSGLAICTAAGDQTEPELIPDGTGGVIVVWSDFRVGDGYYHLFAQRVDGTGTPRWAADGIPICTADYGQNESRIVPDGAGGAIVMWADYRDGQYDIYAQRVNADGDTLWAANGIPIDTSEGDQWGLEAVPDGEGGAYLAWLDTRNGYGDVFAQRIDVDGNILWSEGAVPICAIASWASNIRLAAAFGGSACVAWEDSRDGYPDIHAQKIDQDGITAWENDGVQVCPESWSKYGPQIADDGNGGAIVAWYDERNYYEVYAQRIDSDGNRAWNDRGVLVFPSYGDGDIRIIADGSGGAIVGLDIYWDEDLPSDIYAQRLDHDGNPLWGPKGAAVCLAAEAQYGPALAPDGRGGVIVAWEDYRVDGSFTDIYCQRVGPSGLWGKPEPEIVSCLDLPADQGGWVRVRTRASSHDVEGEYDSPIAGYNVWRMIEGGGGPLALSAAAVSASPSNAPAIERSKLLALLADPATAKGMLVSASQAASLGLPPGDWESVGFWFATRDTVYNIAVPTKDDSTEAGTPLETFIVTAHTSMAGVFVASEPAQGYSVDNLAPGMTAGFEGNESAAPPGLRLSWTPNPASDIWKYDVYQGDNESFVPGVSNLLGSTTGTQIIDGSWMPAYQYFYKLVAVDRHGNASPAALLRPEDIKVGTMLQSFAASLSGAFVEISWTLSEAGADMRFSVLRSSAGAGAFEELDSPAIARSGLSFSLSDRSVEPGTTYRYRIDVIDEAGSRTLFETEAISTPAMPLTLHQNHPNPFNPSTTIGFYLPVDSPVTLDVYDTSGRLVARLLNGAKQAKGVHSVEWRGLDMQGRSVSSGVYFYRLTNGKETISKKMILLR